MKDGRIIPVIKRLAYTYSVLCMMYGIFVLGNREQGAVFVSLEGGAVSAVFDSGTEPEAAKQQQQPQQQIQPKKVALTFDDGPGRYTDELLTALKERGVKATFFVIGSNAEQWGDTVVRMYEEGHLIGNHTYSHVELSRLSVEAAMEELEQTNEVLEKLTGERPEFVRPPYGAWNDCLQNKSQMIMVLWDVDPLDWKVQNCSTVKNCVLKQVEDGDIILLHDIYQSSVTAAVEIVDELQAEGYEFVTVDELILD